MEKQVTKYFCDICGYEVSGDKLMRNCSFFGVKMRQKSNRLQPVITKIEGKDLCISCASKIASMVNVGNDGKLSFRKTEKH